MNEAKKFFSPEEKENIPEPVVQTTKNGTPLRWSVMQFRGYQDFMYGSFDVYVTKEEVVIRGRLKRGQHSLYMRIISPHKR